MKAQLYDVKLIFWLNNLIFILSFLFQFLVALTIAAVVTEPEAKADATPDVSNDAWYGYLEAQDLGYYRGKRSPVPDAEPEAEPGSGWGPYFN